MAATLAPTSGTCASVSAALTTEQFVEKTVVQGYGVSKLHAVYHVVSHFAEHAGQIIFANKLFMSEKTRA